MTASHDPDRTADQLFDACTDWMQKTGWPTRSRDQAMGDTVYAHWIAATDAEWAATGDRDYEALADMLADAFKGLHDDAGITSLQTLFILTFTLRARREGRLVRRIIQ